MDTDQAKSKAMFATHLRGWTRINQRHKKFPATDLLEQARIRSQEDYPSSAFALSALISANPWQKPLLLLPYPRASAQIRGEIALALAHPRQARA